MLSSENKADNADEEDADGHLADGLLVVNHRDGRAAPRLLRCRGQGALVAHQDHPAVVPGEADGDPPARRRHHRRRRRAAPASRTRRRRPSPLPFFFLAATANCVKCVVANQQRSVAQKLASASHPSPPSPDPEQVHADQAVAHAGPAPPSPRSSPPEQKSKL
uniref:Uncharacterized protein n=1 Tax=Aegilops tauschii subsp. strangulata TaxID=200361 RepID=A0A453I5W0_AEGTS